MSTFAVVFLSILFVLRFVMGLFHTSSLFNAQRRDAVLVMVLALLCFATEGYILYNLI